MSNETAYIYARVSQELHARVKSKAEELGISMTQYVTQILDESTRSVQVPIKSVPLEGGGYGYTIMMSPKYWHEVYQEYADDKSS